MTRSSKQMRKMVQIFVKVDGIKRVAMEGLARREGPEDLELREWK